MSNECIADLLYKALEHEAQANINKAEATLEIYFNNSTGIGEHHQHIEEMSKLLDIISTNESKLDIFMKYFSGHNEGIGNK